MKLRIIEELDPGIAESNESNEPETVADAGRLRLAVEAGILSGDTICHKEVDILVTVEAPGLSLGLVSLDNTLDEEDAYSPLSEIGELCGAVVCAERVDEIVRDELPNMLLELGPKAVWLEG